MALDCCQNWGWVWVSGPSFCYFLLTLVGHAPPLHNPHHSSLATNPQEQHLDGAGNHCWGSKEKVINFPMKKARRSHNSPTTFKLPQNVNPSQFIIILLNTTPLQSWMNSNIIQPRFWPPASRHFQRYPTATELCISSQLPFTTNLLWIRIILDKLWSTTKWN